MTHTAIKLTTGQACLLDTGEIIEIHPLKRVDEDRGVDGELLCALNGVSYAAKVLPGSKLAVKRVIGIGQTLVMNSEGVAVGSDIRQFLEQQGEAGKIRSKVHIILDDLHKGVLRVSKLVEALETLVKAGDEV